MSIFYAAMLYRIHMTTFCDIWSEIKGIQSKAILVPRALSAMAVIIFQHTVTFRGITNPMHLAALHFGRLSPTMVSEIG